MSFINYVSIAYQGQTVFGNKEHGLVTKSMDTSMLSQFR